MSNTLATMSYVLLQRLYHQQTERRGVQILSMIMCHNRGQSRLVKREAGYRGARVRKPDQSNFPQVKIVLALLMDTGRAFHKAGRDKDKGLGPPLGIMYLMIYFESLSLLRIYSIICDLLIYMTLRYIVFIHLSINFYFDDIYI